MQLAFVGVRIELLQRLCKIPAQRVNVNRIAEADDDRDFSRCTEALELGLQDWVDRSRLGRNTKQNGHKGQNCRNRFFHCLHHRC